MRAEHVSCDTELLDHKRGDYHEFVLLLLLYLGPPGAAPTPARLQRPGALHKARWMAKLLSTLKLAMLEQRIAALPQGTIPRGNRRRRFGKLFANFIAHVYAMSWLTCNKTVDAAWNDLTLPAPVRVQYHQCYHRSDSQQGAGAAPLIYDERDAPTGTLQHKGARRIDARLGERYPGLQVGRFAGGCPSAALRLWLPKFPTLSPTTSLADLANSDC